MTLASIISVLLLLTHGKTAGLAVFLGLFCSLLDLSDCGLMPFVEKDVDVFPKNNSRYFPGVLCWLYSADLKPVALSI